MGRSALFWLLLFVTAWTRAAVTGPAELFGQQTFLPEGIVVDAQAKVYVFHDAVSLKVVSGFFPDGTADGSIPIGSFFSAVGGRLVLHPDRGTLLLLLSSGEILEIDQRIGAVSPFLDLRALGLDTGAVYDVSVQQVRDLLGVIVTSRIDYGDIALRRTDGGFDLFVSGISLNTPFVARVPVTPEGADTVQVLVAGAGTPGTNNLTRGVAVNPQGTVLTTLPVATLGFPALQDHAVAFSADYVPSDANAAPPMFVLGTNELKSRGMTADAAGNFYVATGARGASACGLGGSGALVEIPPDFSGFNCHNLNLALADSSDLAVSPGNDRLYLTVTNIGAVAAFPLAVTPPDASIGQPGKR